MEFPALSGSNSATDAATSTPPHTLDKASEAGTAKRKIPSGSGILSKIPFLRPASYDGSHGPRAHASEASAVPESLDTAKQTRKRRGSLRKVALLGRGAQRDKHENKPVVTGIGLPGTHHDAEYDVGLSVATPLVNPEYSSENVFGDDKLLFSGSYSVSARHSDLSARIAPPRFPQLTSGRRSQSRSGLDASYASTTDDEDVLHISKHVGSISDMSQSSISEPYLPHRSSLQQRAVQRAKSPLSYDELSSAHLQPDDDDWDYSETEWWGWVVLFTTWFVFVIGMGSCLGVWSWAWDVGTTPYAPPELEDDSTLPIVGYYPALVILSCIMAWVWVVVAWVGMKYFRHAKIGGD